MFKTANDLKVGDEIAIPNPDGSYGMTKARVVAKSATVAKGRVDTIVLRIAVADQSFEMWED